jgi:hypothetical protein
MLGDLEDQATGGDIREQGGQSRVEHRARRQVDRQEHAVGHVREPSECGAGGRELELVAAVDGRGFVEPLVGRPARFLVEPGERFDTPDHTVVEVRDRLEDHLEGIGAEEAFDPVGDPAAFLGLSAFCVGACVEVSLERVGVSPHRGVQGPSLQEVVDAQDDLGVVERFGQEVARPGSQGAISGLGGDVAGQHHHR